MVRMRWQKCEFSKLQLDLPCMAAAFPRPSLPGRDPSCPGWWRSTDRSLTSPAAANCPATTMRTVLDLIPSLIRDWRRRRGGTLSLGKGNHPTMTRPANCVNYVWTSGVVGVMGVGAMIIFVSVNFPIK